MDRLTRIVQLNANHCAHAQDLLVQSAAQWGIHLAVVTEPYRIPPSGEWVASLDGKAALYSRASTGAPPPQRVQRGDGWVAAEIKGVLVVGGYFSPNRTLAEFEDYLRDLRAVIENRTTRHVLLAGDLNAKSAAWGSPVSNARGNEVVEWAAVTGLVVLNKGTAHTCVRRNGGSIVDIGLASADLARRVANWRVLEEAESLSDHRYIRFEVSAFLGPCPLRPLPGDPPRWARKKMDVEQLSVAAITESWNRRRIRTTNIAEETQELMGALTRICDAAMPRQHELGPRRRLYWWSDEIGQLRSDCVAARRRFHRQRRKRRRDEEAETRLYAEYRGKIDALNVEIRRAKSASYEAFIESLNEDPWGRPYKSVRGKMRPWAPPLTRTMEPVQVDRIVAGLFPPAEEGAHPATAAPYNAQEVPRITRDEMDRALARVKPNKAPGLDGIPGRALKLAMAELGERTQELLDECLLQGQFPDPWKEGRLVLIQKEGKPADLPSAYRPIVLLDETGKLFERIIAARLVKHMEEEGPGLSDLQFGFRCAHSTIGAIQRVKVIAEGAVAEGEVVLAVSLDIANAFNSLPWASIVDALRYHRFPSYLCAIIRAYLSNRRIRFPTNEGWVSRTVMRGVPQGSVLGPLLWNIGYDWVLRAQMLRGVALTCYADDTLVTARGKDFRDASIRATAGVAHVVHRIRRLGLSVALEKSEAICFHGPRKRPPTGSRIIVSGVGIDVGTAMRYLGVTLDPRLNFEEHFKRLGPRLLRAAGALSGLLRNVGGPNLSCRRLYETVIKSMALYGAPIWVDALRNKRNRALLRAPQRVMAIRVARGYRTISFVAATALAGTLPWDMEARVLATIYHQVAEARSRGESPTIDTIQGWRAQERSQMIENWREMLREPPAGRRVAEAIEPVLDHWTERGHGTLSFHLTQILTNHGCFGGYLHEKTGREPTRECHHCGHTEDDAQHTLEACPAFHDERAILIAEVGNDLSLPTLVGRMVASDRSWKAVAKYAERVMKVKEEAERERERAADAAPQRRARRGRRRLAHDRRPP